MSNDKKKLEIIQEFHKTLLDALRHREEQILTYITILTPALGGFVWLFNLDYAKNSNLCVFGIGTIGVLFLLSVGAIYSLALGYSYRCLVLQVAKLQAKLNIREFLLHDWPQKPSAFSKQYCLPPEIIKIFWFAFNIAIIGVTLIAVIRICGQLFGNIKICQHFIPYCFLENVARLYWAIIIIKLGIVCEATSLLLPLYYGNKLKKLCKEEPLEWESI